MKQIEVHIMGQSYLLTCPEGGASALLEAVERVDTAMCKIRDAGKVRARERIAVLAALNLAFDQVASAAPAPTSASPSPALAAAPTVSAALAPRLLALRERLDQALAQDGYLL